MGQDLRRAARSLQRSPIFAAAAILTLALGVGGSTVAFTVLDAVLLRPLPFAAPERLVRIQEFRSVSGDTPTGVSAASFEAWRQRARSLADAALHQRSLDPTVVLIDGEAFAVRRTLATANLFAALGVRPALGPGFAVRGSSAPSAYSGEVVVSHGLWVRAFGGSPLAIGRAVSIEGGPPSTVVGVMPPGFSFPVDTDVWFSIDVGLTPQVRRADRAYEAVARLGDGETIQNARAELNTLVTALERELPGSGQGWRVSVVPLLESVVGSYRVVLLVIYLAVASVLLIGCANVANLLLARAVRGRRELAVRAVLGAGRWRLVRQLLAESLLLAAAGGLLGWGLATILLPRLSSLGSAFVPRLADAHLNWTALAYCAAASVATALVVGLAPALASSNVQLQTTLVADGERTGPSLHQSQLQTFITGAQLAVCLVLLVTAMLLLQTFVRLSQIPLGFSPAGIVAVDVRAPIYTTVRERRWYALATTAQTLQERLSALPDVSSVAVTTAVPLAEPPLHVPVRVLDDGRSYDSVVRQVSPGFFSTLSVPLLAGRDFSPSDRATEPQLANARALGRDGVAIVNATLAARLWPAGNAVGQYISTGIDRVTTPRRQVVAVAGDMRSQTLLDPPPAELYVPLAEEPSAAMILLIRTRRAAEDVVPIVRREMRAVDPSLSSANIRTLDDIVTASMGLSPVSTPIVGAFAGLGLLLAATGVYGVFAFAVAGRTREIGVRLALGASSADIAGLFLRQALKPILLGVVAGLSATLLVGRLFGSLLVGVSPTDPVSIVGSTVFLTFVAMVASYLPVRWALGAGPVAALRSR